MSSLGWSESLFVALFLAFGVGGPLLWPSQTIWEALAKIAGGSLIATMGWLAVVFWVDRRQQK